MCVIALDDYNRLFVRQHAICTDVLLLVFDLFIMHDFVFLCATSNRRDFESGNCMLFFDFCTCHVAGGDGEGEFSCEAAWNLNIVLIVG